MKKWIDIFKKTYQEWSDDNCLQIGAALSFYTLGSLIPLLLVITSIFTYVLFFTNVGDNITQQIVDYVSNEVSPQFGQEIGNVLNTQSEGMASGSIISAVIGFISLLFTASGVFGQLDAAFDVIWDVPKENKPSGILATIKAKVFSFGLVLAVAFLLLVSTVLTTALNAVLGALNLGPEWLFGIVNFLANLAIISFVFMLLFKYLPDIKVEWGDVVVGGVLTGILWVVGQQIMSIYFANSSFSSYGIVGGVLAFLVYVYYSSQIVFFGGEFTQAYARSHGSLAVEPTPATQGISPEATLMVQAAAVGVRRRAQQVVTTKEQELATARTKQYAAATTGGIIGLLAGAAIGGAGLIVGVARGVGKLRRG